MSLRILVDECLQRKSLVQMLIAAEHQVLTANEMDLAGHTDEVVFALAIAQNRLVLTSNCDDFITLHESCIVAKQHHPGILLVYLYNDPTKDMSNQQIVKAIANLEKSKIPLADATHSLVTYNY